MTDIELISEHYATLQHQGTISDFECFHRIVLLDDMYGLTLYGVKGLIYLDFIVALVGTPVKVRDVRTYIIKDGVWCGGQRGSVHEKVGIVFFFDALNDDAIKIFRKSERSVFFRGEIIYAENQLCSNDKIRICGLKFSN